MIVRSKRPLIYDNRNQLESVIALRIKDWIRDTKNSKYHAIVEDERVMDANHADPGTPLKHYIRFNQKDVTYSNEQIDGLFTQIGESITPDQSYSQRQDELIVKALLIVTQHQPIYGSTADDWEIVDDTKEIAPSV